MHSAKVDTAMRTFEVMKSTDEKERNGAEDDLKEQSSRKDLIDFSPRRYTSTLSFYSASSLLYFSFHTFVFMSIFCGVLMLLCNTYFIYFIF